MSSLAEGGERAGWRQRAGAPVWAPRAGSRVEPQQSMAETLSSRGGSLGQQQPGSTHQLGGVSEQAGGGAEVGEDDLAGPV